MHKAAIKLLSIVVQALATKKVEHQPRILKTLSQAIKTYHNSIILGISHLKSFP